MPFADLTRCPGVSCLDLQLAIAGEFGRADAVATHGLLDDHARALFDVADSRPDVQAKALLAVMTGDMRFRARSHGEPRDLLLPSVLQTRRGHPLTLAIVARELATRAGIRAGVYSSRTRWFIGLRTDEQLLLLLLDTGLIEGSGRPAQVIGHCHHELAYCTLTGLGRSLADHGQLQAARRASRLKLALPIADDLRAEVQRELDALTPPEPQP